MDKSTEEYFKSQFSSPRQFGSMQASQAIDSGQSVEINAAGLNARMAKIIPNDAPRVGKEAFVSILPLYSLRAAAGYFGGGEVVEPVGWLDATCFGNLDERMFVCQVAGHSMSPVIRNGEYVVFRSNPVGSRQGRIVLAQYRGAEDPDSGGAYTVKRYSSEKAADLEGGWRHKRVVLSPTNPEYEPITFTDEDAEHVSVLAEFVGVLRH